MASPRIKKTLHSNKASIEGAISIQDKVKITGTKTPRYE